MEIIEAPKTIDEEFERSNHTPNAKGLSEDQIRRRDVQTAEMMKLYPKINPLWADLIWNFCEMNPEEAKRVMDSKEWEGPSTIGRDFKGGTIPNALTIENGDSEENGTEEIVNIK